MKPWRRIEIDVLDAFLKNAVMKQNYKVMILSGLLGVAQVCGVSAQKAYTLDECVQKALSNNVKIKNAANELSMAQEDSKEAFTKYFPSVSATAGGFISDNGLAEMEVVPGTSMTMLKNGVTAGVTAALPLFTGGQIVNGNKLAKVGVEVKRLQKNLSEKDVELTAQRYFWQCVVLKEKLKTIESVEHQLASILNDVQASVDAGLTTRNDLLQIQLKQNETLSNKMQLQNALALANDMLAQYIGCAGDSVDVVSPVLASGQTPPDSLYCDHQAVLPRTDEYALLEQNVEASRLQYKMTVGKHMPSVAIGGGYAYHNFLEKDHPFWVGFATVSVPITDWWGGSHAMRKQKLQLENAQNTLNDQSQMLVIRMQNVWNELNDAYKQTEIARLSIEKAEENLRMNKDFYAAGTCTMTDLLQAQTLYRQSRDQYVESCMQYELKKREYIQITLR